MTFDHDAIAQQQLAALAAGDWERADQLELQLLQHLHPTGADDDAAITRAIARQQAELDGVELLPPDVADQLELELPPIAPARGRRLHP